MHNNLKNVRAMTVGNETKCLCCGENYIEASEAMLCNDCLLSNSDYVDDEIVTTCAHCGERILVSEATAAYGNYYCNYCAGEVLVECVHCGQIFNRDNSDEGSWDPIEGWECDNCR
jgi:DNA-directed RNA polymerase subunit RPC12/RpoP